MGNSLLYKIAVTLIKGIGPNLAKNLIAYTGSAEQIFIENGKRLEKIPGIGSVLSKEIVSRREDALRRAEKEIEFIQKNNIQPYYFTENNYSFRLKECADAPIVLYGKGNLNINEGKFIGIVGTRKATEIGKENAKKLISDISKVVPDVTIVSGLAYGIDICAHKSALDSGLPTIGVLGHGLDRIYPAAHSSVARQMMPDGGLLTEFISETNPDRPNFVQRNRIIAGLCDAVVVIESKSTGGALITAVMANDYNRDVFAFPGRIDDEYSAGCNTLIKTNKAQLIESAEDLVHFMNWEKKSNANLSQQVLLFQNLSDEEEALYSLLNKNTDGLHVNEIGIQLSKPFSRVSSLLLQMEFKNLVKCLPGNIYVALR